MECIHEMVVSYEPLKALSLPSSSLAGFIVVDVIGAGMGGCGLGGTIGGSGGGVEEQSMDKRDR